MCHPIFFGEEFYILIGHKPWHLNLQLLSPSSSETRVVDIYTALLRFSSQQKKPGLVFATEEAC